MKGFEHKETITTIVSQDHRAVIFRADFLRELQANVDILTSRKNEGLEPCVLGFRKDSVADCVLHMNLYEIDPSAFTRQEDPHSRRAYQDFQTYLINNRFYKSGGIKSVKALRTELGRLMAAHTHLDYLVHATFNGKLQGADSQPL